MAARRHAKRHANQSGSTAFDTCRASHNVEAKDQLASPRDASSPTTEDGSNGCRLHRSPDNSFQVDYTDANSLQGGRDCKLGKEATGKGSTEVAAAAAAAAAVQDCTRSGDTSQIPNAKSTDDTFAQPSEVDIARAIVGEITRCAIEHSPSARLASSIIAATTRSAILATSELVKYNACQRQRKAQCEKSAAKGEQEGKARMGLGADCAESWVASSPIELDELVAHELSDRLCCIAEPLRAQVQTAHGIPATQPSHAQVLRRNIAVLGIL